MLAVCLSQFFCAVLFFAAGKAGMQRIEVTFTVLRSVVFSLLSAAIVTLILYAPVISGFLAQPGKGAYRLGNPLAVSHEPFVIVVPRD